MKKYFRSPYKRGQFEKIDISDDYTVIVSRGNNRMTWRRTLLGKFVLKKSLLVLVPLIGVVIMFAIPEFKSAPEDPANEYLQDEIEKNAIMVSTSTDYTGRDENDGFSVTEHVVRQGENLGIIARRYGVTVDTICGSNGLRSYDFIQSGVRLRIPSKNGILYRMKKGGNIAAVARKYRVSLEKIIEENKLANPDFVAVGSLLFIPDAKPQNIIQGFIWPVTSKFITCGYGWRNDPFKQAGREFHQGIDIRSSYRRVRASKFGRVTFTGWLGGYGRTIVVAHPGGWKTLYAHLSKIMVKWGQYVKQGQTIGVSGNTGRSTGPHLHFEIMRHGTHRNPHRLLIKK